MTVPVTEADLHAYVDGALPQGRVAEIEAYLAGRPEEAARVASYREQNHVLRRAFDGVLDEPVPERLLRLRRTRFLGRYAAAVAWLALGGVIGWQLHAVDAGRQSEASSWAHRAAMAHVVYSPEVRHAVEVGADQEAHLVAWLSKRLGTKLTIPHLGPVGYALVGGRLLPGDPGPVAQFMYQNANGARLTLYLRSNTERGAATAFRFAEERGVGVFYWVDQKFGYALSGEIDKRELLRVAEAVYKQLNP